MRNTFIVNGMINYPRRCKAKIELMSLLVYLDLYVPDDCDDFSICHTNSGKLSHVNTGNYIFSIPKHVCMERKVIISVIHCIEMSLTFSDDRHDLVLIVVCYISRH